MTTVTGNCLCGQVSFTAEVDENTMAFNCHCADCQKATGALHATNFFLPADKVQIAGETIMFEHESDRGSKMTKHACAKCGSPIYGTNSAREGVVTLRAGALNERGAIKPRANIYTDSASPNAVMDPALKAFPGMPG